jgi:hypothetical protein
VLTGATAAWIISRRRQYVHPIEFKRIIEALQIEFRRSIEEARAATKRATAVTNKLVSVIEPIDCRAASEPIKPAEPVMMATFMRKSYCERMRSSWARSSTSQRQTSSRAVRANASAFNRQVIRYLDDTSMVPRTAQMRRKCLVDDQKFIVRVYGNVGLLAATMGKKI